MSRLTDLIEQVDKTDPQLAELLRAEYGALNERRAYGLNFERHTPETVELPGRSIRRRDKVRFLPERDADKDAIKELDKSIWVVTGFTGSDAKRAALLAKPSGRQQGESIQGERLVSDLVVVAEFRDPIYPGLKSTGKVERGGDKPYHTVINAENYHALEALLYTHEGKVDAIYIDPPYNTGAKDWKYNNDYVEADDLYRHSKWLAFMERRLKLAQRLLNPANSVLVVTIDEKEYLRLGLLLQQVFTEAETQMVSSVINPKGSARQGRFSRTDEYLYFVFLGDCEVAPWNTDMIRNAATGGAATSVRWASLLRNGAGSDRRRIPSLFYPIFLDANTGAFHSVGTPLAADEDRHSVAPPEGTIAMLPVDGNGRELQWRLHPPSLAEYLGKGIAKFGRRDPMTGYRSPQYLQSGILSKIETGDVVITGYDQEGAAQAEFVDGAKTVQPMTVWNRVSHSASDHGAAMLKQLIPDHYFPFPKSLYAVEDTLRFFVKNKSEAVIVDFFAGSGTTAHAVMRLNKQDGGCRQSISVTNNEVSADELKSLRKRGLRPGDADWEALGICDLITKPRIRAAIEGRTPQGQLIDGDYKFTDEFPIRDGFEENVEFFTMTYESPKTVAYNKSFAAVAPLLWLKAGARGSRIEEAKEDFALADRYGILFDLDHSGEFAKAVRANDKIATVFVVTDDEWLFTSVCADLPERTETVRLYSSYLESFTLNAEGRD